MSTIDGAREALRMLNLVEIRGEGSIACMSRAMSILKGIISAFEQAGEGAAHDGDDQQG